MRKGFAFLLVLALACCASAESYYADLTVDVDESGTATFSGKSNHPLLQPQTTSTLTSKRGSYWLFNLTLPEEDLFSDYVYEVKLPAGAEANYVKAAENSTWRITTEGDMLVVKGTGKNTSLSVIIQYRLGSEGGGGQLGLLPLILTAAAILAAFLYLLGRRHGSTQEPAGEEAPKEESPLHDVLSDRQKDILRILKESDKPVNQAALCERLDLPKSSVSRNVNSLAKLGLIEKQRVGMSTFLSLKKQ